ncbi:MAG: amidohydrolase family protein [bacterium]
MKIFDVHVHIQPWWMMPHEVYDRMTVGHADFDTFVGYARDPDAFLHRLDNEGIERVALINYVSPDIMGFTAEVNEFISNYCKADPARLIPCGSVNPRFTADPAADINRLVQDLGIRMLKLHPPHMLFYPDDYQRGLRPLAFLYEQAQRLKIPVMIHTGTSIFPNARSKFGNPMGVDDVAIDFPELTIILAHGGRPIWMNESFFLVRRHKNVYLDISGIPPKSLLDYFPRLETIADKTLFGSDWPGPMIPGMRANADAVAALPLSDQTKSRILFDNAARLFPA